MEKRKKLGGTPMSTLQNQETDVSQKVSKKGDRAGFLTFDKGWNKFRYFPAHPETESFMYASVRYFVPAIDDDGKRVKKAVFNSKVHGGTDKDIIEEYIKYLTEVTLSHLQGPALEAMLKPIVYNGDYNLAPKIEWVGYANKYTKEGKKIAFGRFSITPGTKNKLEKLVPTEANNEAITIEPFTDEEDGIAVILTYDPNAKDKKGNKDAKNFYNVELEQKKEGKFDIKLVPTPLSEKEMEDFLKQETLQSMYKNSYRLRDFNIALAGLQIIDKECKFDVLKDSGFLEIVEEIRNYYPEDDETTEGETEPESSDDLDKLTRDQLKVLIVEEFGRGVIIIRTNNTEDQIRDMIRAKRKELAVQPEIEKESEIELESEISDVSPFDDKQGEIKVPNSLKAMREKMQQRKTGDKK